MRDVADDMTLEEIETMALAQLAGSYTTESDAMSALNLIAALARRLRALEPF